MHAMDHYRTGHSESRKENQTDRLCLVVSTSINTLHTGRPFPFESKVCHDISVVGAARCVWWRLTPIQRQRLSHMHACLLTKKSALGVLEGELSYFMKKKVNRTEERLSIKTLHTMQPSFIRDADDAACMCAGRVEADATYASPTNKALPSSASSTFIQASDENKPGHVTFG
mmetsp:Transcript_25433/g.41852  ORF Transcript_25433/g.41852 Transcript_25433/m.41852 type:complete len:172 (+) Transcript_25433:406-921(+)